MTGAVAQPLATAVLVNEVSLSKYKTTPWESRATHKKASSLRTAAHILVAETASGRTGLHGGLVLPAVMVV